MTVKSGRVSLITLAALKLPPKASKTHPPCGSFAARICNSRHHRNFEPINGNGGL
jgi:hypothetical protein